MLSFEPSSSPLLQAPKQPTNQSFDIRRDSASFLNDAIVPENYCAYSRPVFYEQTQAIDSTIAFVLDRLDFKNSKTGRRYLEATFGNGGAVTRTLYTPSSVLTSTLLTGCTCTFIRQVYRRELKKGSVDVLGLSNMRGLSFWCTSELATT